MPLPSTDSPGRSPWISSDRSRFAYSTCSAALRRWRRRFCEEVVDEQCRRGCPRMAPAASQVSLSSRGLTSHCGGVEAGRRCPTLRQGACCLVHSRRSASRPQPGSIRRSGGVQGPYDVFSSPAFVVGVSWGVRTLVRSTLASSHCLQWFNEVVRVSLSGQAGSRGWFSCRGKTDARGGGRPCCRQFEGVAEFYAHQPSMRIPLQIIHSPFRLADAHSGCQVANVPRCVRHHNGRDP